MSTKIQDLELNNALRGKASHAAARKRRPARKLSAFSKTFITVLLIHAVIMVVLGLGVQQPEVLILAGIESAVAGLTLFGLRWPPLIGGLLGLAMLLVFTTATGFPIHHLTHPKDAFGYNVIPAFSFLMYMVMTGLFWCAAVLMVVGVTAVVHNYFFFRWQTFPWFRTVMTGVVCLWVGAVLVGALTQPDKPLPVGANTVALSVGSFSQPTISLKKGESLTLVDSGSYHHNLSMGRWISGHPILQNQAGAPNLKNKDVNGSGVTVIVGPFNTAGTFYIICSLHHNMQLKVTVT